MTTLENIIRSTIQDHPLVEMQHGKEIWCACPADGWTSKHFSSFNEAVLDFQNHLADVMNEELGLTKSDGVLLKEMRANERAAKAKPKPNKKTSP